MMLVRKLSIISFSRTPKPQNPKTPRAGVGYDRDIIWIFYNKVMYVAVIAFFDVYLAVC